MTQQPIYFVRDPERVKGRVFLMTALVVLPVGGYSFYLMLGLEADSRSPPMYFAIASLVVLMLPMVVFPFFWWPRADDWLRLDADGVAESRRGRLRHWRRSEISGIRRHGLFHPATLLLGHFVSMRLKDGGTNRFAPRGLARLFLPRGTFVVGNDYLTPIDRIAARLTAYLTGDAATSNDAEEPLPVVDGPVMIQARPDPKGHSWWMVALTTLAVSLIATVTIPLVIELAKNSWDWHALVWSEIEKTAIVAGLPVIVCAVTSLPSEFRQKFVAQNFLLFSDDGLHIRERGHRKHWSWREISGYRLERAGVSTQVGEARHPAKYITLDAARDGTKPWEAGPAKATAVTIEDRYEAPIEEIARQIGLWRERGRVLDATPLEADGFVLNETPEPGDGTVTYGRRFPADKIDSITAVLVAVSQIAFIGWLAYTLWWLGQPHEAAEASSDLVAYASIGLTILIPIPLFSIPMLALLPGINYLRLSPTGVVLARMGIKRRWPWAGISGIETRTGKFFWRKQGRSYVSFAVRRDDPLSRFARWCYGVSRARPTVILEDIYDTRPEALARALTERWNRGQRMGGAR